jgi:hypothetical protein
MNNENSKHNGNVYKKYIIPFASLFVGIGGELIKKYKIPLALLCLGVLGVFFVLNDRIQTYIYNFLYFQDEVVIAEPSGHIFLNLTKSGEGTKLFTYDFDSSSINEFQIPYLTPSASTDEGYIIGSAYSKEGDDLIPSIFLVDNSAQEILLYASSTAHSLFRNPKIYTDGQTYTFEVAAEDAFTGNDINLYTPSAWSIYLGQGRESNPLLIARGVFAHFSPDGTSMLYLTDDGLHQYNIGTQEDTLVWPIIDGNALTNLMVTVSKNGDRIAITNPLASEVTVASIQSWSPFTITDVRNFRIQAFWPVFSPDGNYLALEQVDWDRDVNHIDTVAGNARLTIINLYDGTMNTVHDLSDFEQTALFMTEWLQE